MLKGISTGTNNFKKLIESNSYYIDKTKIIEELIIGRKEVYLFPRPRRFGKSLFISMLDNFFNIEYKDSNKNLFDDLNISKSEYYAFLSTKPVINISFREIESDNYESMYSSFKELIREVYSKKKYLLNILDEYETEIFNSFLSETATLDKYKKSIYLLSDFMSRYYNKKVVILIDEYDVPLQNGFLNGFYDEIIKLIRGTFSNALKDNEYLDFGVVTGVLRISGESLFSTFNNPDVYSIMDKRYNEYFGFTEKETKELLEYYGLELNKDVKEMYDGYVFGGVEIYNPWSILKYAYNKVLNPYWLNTSRNSLIINSIKNCTNNVKVIIEKLLLGESYEITINEQITYENFNDLTNVNNILNLLLMSGYLKVENTYINDSYEEIAIVKLPNMEVAQIFKRILVEVLISDLRIDKVNIDNFCNAVIDNNKELMQALLNKILPNKSYMDTGEDFYQGYLLGIFSLFLNNKKYIVDSNREAGNGRFDLMIKDKIYNIGIVLELKVTDGDMEEGAIKGLNQIENKEYYLDLIKEGYKDIRKIAICFKDKECCVR